MVESDIYDVQLLMSIISSPLFSDTSSVLLNGKSVYDVCLDKVSLKQFQKIELRHKLLQEPKNNPNKVDKVGNSVLFYVCQYFELTDVVDMITDKTIPWDFKIKNLAGDTVYDHYKGLCTSHHTVHKILAKKCGQKDQKSTGAASVDITKVDLAERMIDWWINPTMTAGSRNITVAHSTDAFYRDKEGKISASTVYDLRKKLKGKVCILSVPEFKSPDLSDLLGYKEDEKNLVTLWKKMGFTVLATRYDGQYYLTAKEIEQAVKEFGSKLTDADQCAVLCILSHGGDGFIYGSDGDTVDIRKLLSYLDNTSCPKMKEKPKFIVFQTCQGNRSDAGITASPASNTKMSAIAAAGGVRLPSISDFLVCAPSLPGYTSFVWTDPTCGSVFINALIDVLSQNAHDMDLNGILTLVNAAVCDKDIPVVVTGSTRTVDRKQMSHFDSCLTKLLYFFPGIDK